MRMEDYLEKTIPFPKGLKFQKNGINYTGIILRELGGLDEEIISKPEYRDSLVKIQGVALQRCIAGLIDEAGKEVVTESELPTLEELNKLPMAFIDLLFLELRSVTLGDTIVKSMKCPEKECDKRIEPSVNLEELRSETVGVDFGERTVVLDRGLLHEGTRLKKAKVVPVKAEVRAKLFSAGADLNDFGGTNSEFLYNSIVDIDGIVLTKDMVSNLKKADRVKIFEAVGGVKPFELSREFVCPYCKKSFAVEVDLLDFLF